MKYLRSTEVLLYTWLMGLTLLTGLNIYVLTQLRISVELNFNKLMELFFFVTGQVNA